MFCHVNFFIAQFWLCEHCCLVECKMADSFPRFLKWDLNDVNKALERVKLSKKGIVSNNYFYLNKTIISLFK